MPPPAGGGCTNVSPAVPYDISLLAMRIPVLVLLALLSASNLAVLSAEELAGGTRHVSGEVQTSFTIGTHGASIQTPDRATLRQPIQLVPRGRGGLEAAFFAGEPAGEDWRKGTTPLATRTDTQIDNPPAADGTMRGWTGQAAEWNGLLAIPFDGYELALTSNTACRVWLAADDPDASFKPSWGKGGWGGGQGRRFRPVHRNVPAGQYQIRVQGKQVDGNESLTLSWRHSSSRTWQPIPAEAFNPLPSLTLSGKLTLAAPISGHGRVILAAGVEVRVAPAVDAIEIIGAVRLGTDLDLRQVPLIFSGAGSLLVGDHRLRLGSVSGAGTVILDHGLLDLPEGRNDLDLAGTGTVHGAGRVECRRLGPELTIVDGKLTSANRSTSSVRLAAPLTTIVQVGSTEDGRCQIVATVTVPADAPADLGIGGWRADRQGQWFQQVLPERLHPGTQEVTIDLSAAAPLTGEGHRGRWSVDAAANPGKAGIFLFSAQNRPAEITLDARLVHLARTPIVADSPALTELEFPAMAMTGERWTMSLRPMPYPANPYDPAEFTLDLTVTRPDGQTLTIPGFHDEPVEAIDAGNREEFRSSGPPTFRLRYRPQVPGIHHLRLTAHWAGHPPVIRDLPALTVTGLAWDGYVRTDPGDPRFFSIGGKFFWPAGANFNSTYDVRSQHALRTKLTPDRGSFTRDALLQRLAAGGGTVCETWLSPWNMGLEWIDRWPGYRGAGRYHAGHAWAFDRFLDRAEQLGVKVNVTLFNHGMARAGSGAEDDWKYHPYNIANGGWLREPRELFTDDRAFTAQTNLFRYLAGRYGDSPAILGWKLWAEVNLVNCPTELVTDWHRRASEALLKIDPGQHPVTSHWSGDWRVANREICALPSIGYLTIDAYKGDDVDLSKVLSQSTRDPQHSTLGLRKYGKPVLVAEFGGWWGGSSVQRMRAEHASGPWIGLVTGHAGSPLLWWFELIDQENRFGIYGALGRFLVGEDLRGKIADSAVFDATAPGGSELWCRAWTRPGRILGYLLASEWGRSDNETTISDATITIGETIPGGAMTIEWWQADEGRLLSRTDFTHPGGKLVLTPPVWSRHLAFKLIRTSVPAAR